MKFHYTKINTFNYIKVIKTSVPLLLFFKMIIIDPLILTEVIETLLINNSGMNF